MKQGIQNYEHPYLTVDCVLFRYHEKGLEALLHHRDDEYGAYAFPGSFVPIDRLAEDVLRETVAKKVGARTFYMEQLRTYDGLNRDPRGRIISMAYLGLTNEQEEETGWFRIERETRRLRSGSISLSFDDLAFDHGQILEDAINRLVGKLWWSDLAAYLLPEHFSLRDVSELYEYLEGKKTWTIGRQLGDRIEEVGLDHSTGGRPQKLYRWKKKTGNL